MWKQNGYYLLYLFLVAYIQENKGRVMMKK